MSVFGDIKKDIIAYLPAKIVPAVFGFVSVPIITRLFDPDIYGTYTLVYSAATLVSFCIFNWYYQYILRFYEQEVGNGQRLAFITSLSITWFVLIIVLLLLILILLQYLPPLSEVFVVVKQYWVYFFLLVASHSAFSMINYLMRAARKSREYAILSILLPLLRIMLIISLAFKLQAHVTALFLSLILSELVLTLIGLPLFGFSFSLKYFCFSQVKSAFRYGMPMVGVFLLNWLLDLSDRYIIAYYLGLEDVGVYAVAYNLGANSIQLVFMVLMFASYATIVSVWNKSGAGATSVLLRKLTGVYFVTTIPILVGIAALGRVILQYLVTDHYSAGYQVLPLVAGGFFLLGYSQYLNKVWVLTEQTGRLLYFTLAAVTINIVLNLLLVPKLGFLGAGVSTIAGYAAYLLFSWLEGRKLIALSLDWHLLGVVAVSVLMMVSGIALLGVAFKESLLLLLGQVAVGAVLYAVCILWLGHNNSTIKEVLHDNIIKRRRGGLL